MNGLPEYKHSLPKEVRASTNEVKLMRRKRNLNSLGRKRKSLYAKFAERIALFFYGQNTKTQTLTWKDMCTATARKEVDEDAYIKLCKNSKPDDFYFAVDDSDPERNHRFADILHIVPREWFYYSGASWYGRLYIDHLLPEGFKHWQLESWLCNRSVEEVDKDMLGIGFRQHPKFTDLCSGR